MKHSVWMLAVAAIFNVTTAFADVNPDVTQGASAYDWQSCFESKQSDCVNNCVNSEELDCAGDCAALAKDKCQSLGLTPP